ncbi:MAG: ATP-binding protein [Muribaculaceae bacterium]|nr:ATP-binding protein [Muribaculaceae bacterium]
MKDIKAIKGKYYIHRLIEEGEHEHQDFKYAITDSRKIARSISAFANNDGGRLLVGVKDNGHIVGIPNEEDIYMLEHAAEAYCDPPQEIEISAWAVEGGAVVLSAVIPKFHDRPVYCIEEGNRKVAYYRVNDENIVAHDLMVRSWIYQNSTSRSQSLCKTDYQFLQFLAENGDISPEEYILSSHVSTSTANRTIIHLLSTGIIEMFHTPTGFRVRHIEVQEE